VSESTILGLAGIAGTLVGVWLGYWLQQAADSRRRLQEACTDAIAGALEAAVMLEQIEASISEGEPVPVVRPELAREWFQALARLGLASPVVADAAANLSNALGLATSEQASAKPEDRAAARAAVMKEIEGFQIIACREMGRRLPRMRGRGVKRAPWRVQVPGTEG
jgi:hypothetical protein